VLDSSACFGFHLLSLLLNRKLGRKRTRFPNGGVQRHGKSGLVFHFNPWASIMLGMPALIENNVVEETLRSVLQREGFELSLARKNGEIGVDILATRGPERIFIECIGYKSSGPARAKDFYEVFLGRYPASITVLRAWSSRYLHALNLGLSARALQHRVAWERIAVSFAELEIWLVDTQTKTCSRRTWTEWLASGHERRTSEERKKSHFGKFKESGDPAHDAIQPIRIQLRQSWANLRRGAMELSGPPVKHSTRAVRTGSLRFARRAAAASGLSYDQVIARLDSSGL
jgi:hypothetical protein